MDKLLSIIVLTYNMEAYLDKCLTSLIVGEADSKLMQKLEVLANYLFLPAGTIT
ncbi:MAG: hypothetical protein MJZ32_12010 [Bacteroidaceae bacterium]|nr:hypothetical protein [Bacteroidaceae bacterium]